MLYVLSIVLFIIAFSLLYSIYKTKRYNKPSQVIPAICGAIILVYILYTCQSDQ
jgi:uncharacterized membrane protein YeaQ/YmgE (transglycosylase-associated protein family)